MIWAFQSRVLVFPTTDTQQLVLPALFIASRPACVDRVLVTAVTSITAILLMLLAGVTLLVQTIVLVCCQPHNSFVRFPTPTEAFPEGHFMNTFPFINCGMYGLNMLLGASRG